MTDTFDFPALRAELTEDEGVWRFPYLDSTGHVGIGIGRNLTGAGVSPAEISKLWHDDVAVAITALDANTPWWRNLAPGRQRVMINLCFNLGWTGLSEFVVFLVAMRAGAWADACAALKDSAWWGEVGDRGPRMTARILAQEPLA